MMKNNILKYCWILFCIGISSFCWGIEVPVQGIDTCTLSPGSAVTVTEPHVDSGICYGAMIVKSEDESVMYISGTYNFDETLEFVDIYDGTNTSGRLLGSYRTTGNIPELCCYSGSLYICFYSENKSTNDVFNLRIRQCTPSANIFNIDSYAFDDNNTMVMWEDTSGTTEWRVVYGTLSRHVSYVEEVTEGPMILLPSYNCFDRYFCRIFDANDSLDCGSTLYQFNAYPGAMMCDNYTDFHSCRMAATYGDYNNPYQNVGIVDYGSQMMRSRHTVNMDTSEFDRNVGNHLLRKIPSGEISSIRLGNQDLNAQAESISYLYTVDTSIYDLLIMKYAVVMQDPNHTPENQPKFEFEVLNEDGEEVNSECYSRHYVANLNLGWQSTHSLILWKDWTTVGIPLDNLHGQNIKIRFTTYDCALGGHFGYAYFNLKCSNQVITSTSCGDMVANTFKAPDGFNYEWYNANDSTVILSTVDSLSVTEAGTYKCRLKMLDVSDGLCDVVLTVTATTRYPFARFTSQVLGHECERRIHFMERSVVATNIEHTSLLSESCEEIFWDFGDGEFSSERNPIHRYDQCGVYEVMMVASLAGGMCTDTVRQMVEVGMNCEIKVIKDSICSDETYTFFGRVLSSPGKYMHVTDTLSTLLILEMGMNDIVYRFDTVVENQLPYHYKEYEFDTIVEDQALYFTKANGCDSIVHYNLMVHYNTYAEIEESLCDDELPYIIGDVEYDTAGIYHQTLIKDNGADSIVVLKLNVNPSYSVEINDTICEGEIYHFENDDYSLPGTYISPMVTEMGCDSVITLNLDVLENKFTVEHLRLCKGMTLTWQDGNTYDDPTAEPMVVFEASNGCDSVVQLSLDTSILDARCKVTPLHVSIQNPTIELVDNSIGNDSRIWYLPNMVSDDKQWEYNYPLMEDSIMVLLVAMDTMNCVDSTSVWVYMTDAQIWMPNVFTPGEETNNIFRASYKDLLDIEVMIFDRRGQFIYSYNTLDGGWDGTMNGVECPQGAYVYKVRYHTKTFPKRVKTIVGTVTLLR